MSFRLIALDIDGTIRTHGSPISGRAKAAIERVRSAGAVVTLATGRTFESALGSAEELDITSPMAAFQGAQVSDPVTHRVLWRRPLTPAMARRALGALEDWPVEVMAYHEDDVYVSRMTRFADGYRDRNGINVELVDDLRDIADWNLTRLLAVAEEETVAELNAHLRRTQAGELYVTRSLPHFCEILNPAGGKEKALSWICHCLGIEPSEVLAFGNGYNDVPMLEWAGLGVAIGDGVDEAKQAADLLAPGIEDDGVAQMLESMLDAGQIGKPSVDCVDLRQWMLWRADGEEGTQLSSDPGKPAVVVLGSVNMDLVVHTARVPEPGETIKGGELRTAAGGKGANQAVAAARLGASVRMVGRVGGDEFGRSLLAGLSSHGVDITGVAVDADHASGVAIILLDAEKENRIVVVSGANMECGRGEEEAVARALDGAQVMLVQHEIPMQVNLDAARHACEAGTKVVWNPAPFEVIPEDAYSMIEVITPNSNEAAALTGVGVSDASSAASAAQRLLERGVGAAVVTLGELGAVYATRGESGYVVAPSVEPVDTVGAGDAFNGALAVSLAEGRPLLDAVRCGVMAGTAAVTRAGAQDGMPDREAVEAMLRRL